MAIINATSTDFQSILESNSDKVVLVNFWKSELERIILC